MDNSSYRLIPTQTLSELSLSGFTEASSLQPNSIHFSLLKILKIACVQRIRGFPNAFVVPNLERFHCFLMTHLLLHYMDLTINSTMSVISTSLLPGSGALLNNGMSTLQLFA